MRLVFLTEQVVKFVMSADPCPNDRVAVAFADGTVLFIDPNRPDMIVAGQFLEAK